MEQKEAIAFILRLGRALHAHGCDAQRLEEVMNAACQRLGLHGQFFSTPTSIFAAFGPQESQQTFLIRVEPGGTDLGKLADLDEVTANVLRGHLAPAQGAQRITDILARPPQYGRLQTTLAFGMSSAAASRFLGGGAREICVAAAVGLAIGMLAFLAARRETLGRIFELIAALAASAMAAVLGATLGTRSLSNDILAGLIVFMPGLTLTTAMTELSTRHLVSGTARLSAAFAVFLQLGFGVALGGTIMNAVAGPPRLANSLSLPGWTEIIALLLASLAFTVLLRAHRRDAFWIVLAGACAVAGSRFGAHLLGAELGVFIGALSVGIASNLYGRFLQRPADILLVPGILLLVPGSVGFRSLAAMLDREVIPGIETAFKMILIAIALAAGILVAKIIAPPRPIV